MMIGRKVVTSRWMRTAVARKEVVEMAAPSMQVTRYPASPSR